MIHCYREGNKTSLRLSTQCIMYHVDSICSSHHCSTFMIPHNKTPSTFQPV